MPRNLSIEYEKQLQKAILEAQKIIKRMYDQSILEISLKASTINLTDGPFSLSLYPLLEKSIDAQINRMHRQTYDTIVSSVRQAWALSNQKNDIIVDRRLASKEPTQRAKQILYDPNQGAMEAYIQRVENGLDLGKRVWKGLEPFKPQLEQGLGLGLKEGKAAGSLASELQKYLNEPDKLFRRVRGEDGKLHLSQAARDYHPGQGVYRSSFKNAFRLTRTETNMAYRTSDFERWQNMPFVIGFRIRLSNAHPHYDICDTLVGLYPKDFFWKGWHPQCICYMVPEMVSDEEYDQMEDYVLGLTDVKPDIRQVEHVPEAFHTYVKEHGEQMKGWKNQPYWMLDNKDYVKM